MPAARRARHLAAVMLALGASACTTLGPDYTEPSAEWLSDWQPDLYGQAAQQAQAPDLDLWWQRFHDPVLEDLVGKARAQNPGLRIAGLRILESRALQGIASGLQYPQLQQISASGVFVTQDTDGGINDGHRDFRSGDAAFTVGWEIDFWGRFRRGIESADAAYFASVSNQRDAQVLLAAQVATLYYSYKTTLLRIEIARNNVQLQQRSLQITQKLFDEGQDSELDVQQAKAQYLGTLATIPALQLGLTQTRNALAAVLGRGPGDVAELDAVDSSLPELDTTGIAAMPAELLLRRPDVRSAAWQAAAQSAQIGIARADLYPAISLGGSIGWSGNSLDTSGDTTRLAGGPALTWNIFNYGRLKNNVRAQDARFQQLLENFQATVLSAAQEVDNSAAKIAQTGASQDILDQSVTAAERSLEIATKRYSEGYSDFQRVLDAQAASFSQADRAIVNRGDHVAAVIALYKALGGGWQPAAIEDILPAATRDAMRERSDWGELLDPPLAEPPQPEDTP